MVRWELINGYRTIAATGSNHLVHIGDTHDLQSAYRDEASLIHNVAPRLSSLLWSTMRTVWVIRKCTFTQWLLVRTVYIDVTVGKGF